MFNKYFIESVENLDIKHFVAETLTNEAIKGECDIENIIRKYEKHRSIVKIKEIFKLNENLNSKRLIQKR